MEWKEHGFWSQTRLLILSKPTSGQRMLPRVEGRGVGVGPECKYLSANSPPPPMASWSSPQLSKPEKVSIPERYVDLDPEEPPSLEELQARYRKAEKIRSILTRSRSALLLPLS